MQHFINTLNNNHNNIFSNNLLIHIYRERKHMISFHFILNTNFVKEINLFKALWNKHCTHDNEPSNNKKV